MILAAAVAALLGVGLGYLLGIHHQAREEIIPDAPRRTDIEQLHRSHWELIENPFDREFLQSARLIDSDCETVHHVPLAQIVQQVGDESMPAQRQAERTIIDAIKIDRTTGKPVRAIFRNETGHARSIAAVLRKTGLRVALKPMNTP